MSSCGQSEQAEASEATAHIGWCGGDRTPEYLSLTFCSFQGHLLNSMGYQDLHLRIPDTSSQLS